MASIAWLVSCCREDFRANRRDLTNPGLHAVIVYRFGVWAGQQQGLTRRVGSLIYRILSQFTRSFYSIELPREATIGRRLWIPYPVGIVVSRMAEIGDDCMIHQSVTIGSITRGRTRTPPFAPSIGNRVEIGAGAVILGGVTIGDEARIGANAVVMRDVPAGGTAFAPPATIMKPLGKKQAEDSELAGEGDG